jgi:hypothetical protein
MKLTIELEVEATDLRLFENDDTLMHECEKAIRRLLLDASTVQLHARTYCDPTPYSHNANITSIELI